MYLYAISMLVRYNSTHNNLLLDLQLWSYEQFMAIIIYSMVGKEIS